jgi:hypothetical protein
MKRLLQAKAYEGSNPLKRCQWLWYELWNVI